MKPPLVSIVMPLFDDEHTLIASITSALAQTLESIEVICVDDGSADATVAIVSDFVYRDSRVRLIRHDRNRSAFQARRTGILAAAAPYVLFLDGDDELEPHAAARALAEAEKTDADVIGFGVTVVELDGRTGGSYERRLQPRHKGLEGAAILAGLFPIGMPAQGQLWRYMFKTELVRRAYSALPQDLELTRVNDLPLMFMVAVLANRYVAFQEKLYRYHFGRGGSGQLVESIERAEFYASAIRSMDVIQPSIAALSQDEEEIARLLEAYESARLSIVGYVCAQLLDKSDVSTVDDALAHLHTVATATDILRGVARFYPHSLISLKRHTPWHAPSGRPPRSILIATSTFNTGGVSSVIASQAQYLVEAGYQVTVVARSRGSDPSSVPQGVGFVELHKHDLVDRLEEWAAICRSYKVDTVIDHQVLYTRYWPEFALAARGEGAMTVGWLHNFVGRPVFDGREQLSLIEQYSNTLSQLIVLSPLDVAYFKLRGVEHVSYIPNPPSPLLRNSLTRDRAKATPGAKVKLVWWGRLEEHTKRVTELIEIAVHLKTMGLEFSLTVVGPDWADMTAKKFNAMARRRGVGSHVCAIGPRHGEQLIRIIDDSDAFVSTSIIEGYQLTIAEAQARGLPVFMYELPWLTLVDGNGGLVAVRQGDAHGLAQQIFEVMRDPGRYRSLSSASVQAAELAIAPDFRALYEGALTGSVAKKYSPAPTLADARQLLRLLVFFAERSHDGPVSSYSGAAEAGGVIARAWRTAAPLGRATLRWFPGLRPLAHRAKEWLRVR